jgi:hypothetical protein
MYHIVLIEFARRDVGSSHGRVHRPPSDKPNSAFLQYAVSYGLSATAQPRWRYQR